MDVQSASKLLYVNLKRNFLPHFIIAVIVSLLTPVVFSISSLDEKSAAQPVEMLLSLTGTILMTPVFLPEQNENIRDLIRSKKTDYLSICVIRLVYSIFALAAIIGVFVIIMYFSESDISIRHFAGGFSTAFFLGSIGFFAAAVSESTTVGYMVSLMYYIANIGLKDQLGKIYLFSMSAGSFEEKYWISAVSFILLLSGLLFKSLLNKIR